MFITIIVFLFGLATGSGLNALAWRLHQKKSWTRGSSICPSCKHKLAWYDLVPLLSFFLLQGKCRYCQKKISIQYPLVELATGVVFVLVYLSSVNFQIISQLSQPGYQQLATLILNLGIATVLILIFVYDLKHYLILDKVILPAIVVVFVSNLFLGKSWQAMLLAAFIASGFFLIQFVISKGTWIGGGDIRLGFFMGLILGWPHILTALFLAYILGSIISILLVALGIKKWQSKIPFAAFLCPAAFITLLFAEELLSLYFKFVLLL